jgi:hypothetical protein
MHLSPKDDNLSWNLAPGKVVASFLAVSENKESRVALRSETAGFINFRHSRPLYELLTLSKASHAFAF